MWPLGTRVGKEKQWLRVAGLWHLEADGSNPRQETVNMAPAVESHPTLCYLPRKTSSTPQASSHSSAYGPRHFARWLRWPLGSELAAPGRNSLNGRVSVIYSTSQVVRGFTASVGLLASRTGKAAAGRGIVAQTSNLGKPKFNIILSHTRSQRPAWTI